MGTSGKSNASYAEQQSSRAEQQEDRPSEQSKDAATVFKGTTLPHIVVKRQLTLHDACFITSQFDKSIDKGKAWQLHRRTLLEPASPSQIRAHERHLRKAGPLRALSAYARDKNVLKLYCFRVEWPDKYAPSHGSSVELGFDSLATAQEWHAAIAAQVVALGGSGAGSAHYSLAGHSNSNSLSGGMYGNTGYASAEPSPFTSPVSSFPNTPALLSKQPSMATDGCLSPTQPGTADGSNGGLNASNRSSSSQELSQGGSAAHLKGSSLSLANSAAGAAGGGSAHSSINSGGQLQQLLQQGSGSGAAAAAGVASAAELAASARAHASSMPGSTSGRRQQQQRQSCGAGGSSSANNTGVVVDECMVRWVPYKHANGMAIYYRQTPQEEGRGMPQASGEYMLSTAVQASPECCVSNLMLKADKGSVLSTAAFMEVLEDNGDMQVWHMVFHPAGNTGLATVLAAPRYTFMHQVLTSYEEGVYAVLFSSVPDEDVKPEWMQRASARTQRAHRAVLRSDPGSGSRKPLWRTPVRCRITGAITLSALEGRTGRDSPQTLVTCIVRADFGGWLGSSSYFYGLGQALGLQEALMDRVLMRVMILKEDVEYSRFKTKPFQLLMVTPEDYESSGQQQQQQQQHVSVSGGGSSSGAAAAAALQQQQQQQSILRQAAPQPPVLQLQPSQPHVPTLSLQLPVRRSTNSNAGAAAAVASVAAAEPGQQGPSGDKDLMSRTQSAAGAVAVATAARVSAAASALAAHMTNPQQLWHEKRGSTSGFSASNTPPTSPSKHSAGTYPVLLPIKRPYSSPAETSSSYKPPAPGQLSQRQQQQQHIQVSAADSGSAAAAATAAAAELGGSAAAGAAGPERFFSLPGSTMPAAAAAAAAGAAESGAAAAGAAESGAAAAAGAAASTAAAAAGAAQSAAAASRLQQQQQQRAAEPNGEEQQDSDFEQFEDVGDSSLYAASTSSAGAAEGDAAAVDIDAASVTGSSGGDKQLQHYPFSEEQLQALIAGSLNRQYWEPIHDGVGSVRDVYSIRGPQYLKDRKKIPAGRGRYKLMAADLVATHSMMDHIGRFLPSVRCSGAAFSFVVNLIINYGSPVLHLVMVFSTDRHPNSLGPCPDDPLDAGEEWTPFDFTMSRFLHGTDEERNGMFKLIPHCAKGSWVVSQSVGTTPVILGRKLATSYHTNERYIEVDVDVASTQAVAYIVKMVQGATRSMLIDHAYLLEAQFAHELPEQLIGAIRYKHLDMTDYTFLPVEQELPFTPVVPGIVGQ
uniref:Protein ENHANCED DISEASE RESISTANCE 2 C-terminal domain-containing protein n=1 Tax=Tetradesmus obliquus TaxID=3088 RepID=A0A383WFV0_TETOB|eukprot:jgi/Sobl393_1/16997/SZX76415.1